MHTSCFFKSLLPLLFSAFTVSVWSQMPNEIEPLNTPFSMPQLSRPTFPARTVDITHYGAKPGKTATKVLQKAIDQLSAKGGGTVLVPAGKWLTGRIVLKSNINLHLAEGAELHFSGAIKDYLPVVLTRNEGVDIYSLGAMVYANGTENIAITGKGKLVGPDTRCEIYQRSQGGIPAEVEQKPLDERVFDGAEGAKVYLPVFFGPIHCKNVFVEGVTFRQSLFWNLVPTYCENIIIRGVTVNSYGHPRTDGIDIDSSVNTLIEYTTLDCGDDCFTLKAGRGAEAVDRKRPTENVIIRHCTAQRGVGGITVGSETAGVIRNVYVHDCVFENTQMPFYFKTRRPRGGGAEHLIFERIHVNSCKKQTILFDMLGNPNWIGELGNRLPLREINKLTPRYSDLTFKDLVIDSCTMLIKAKGLPEQPIEGIVLENIQSPSWQMSLQDVGTLTIR